MGLKQHQLREISDAIDVTEYAHYQDYLEAIYRAAKTLQDSYSYAHLSVDLGLSSTNAFAIINGSRKLSEKIATRIAEKLSLSAKHRKYLLGLVRQTKANSSQDRDSGFQQQLEIVRDTLPSELDRRRLLFFEHWYNAAIIELMRLDNASDDPQWISQHLCPRVSLSKVKASLELLTSLGYLSFNNQIGRLYPTETTISTGDQVERLAILSYHRQMIDLAVNALDLIEADKRDISAITLSVSNELRDQLIRELIALRKRFLQLAADEKSPHDIVQVNMQIFSMLQKRPVKRGVK